jgi:HEAT repeat protein
MVVVCSPQSFADQSQYEQAVTAAGVPDLIRTVLENAELSGHIVKRLEAQRKLAAYGKRDRQNVVPLLIHELERLAGYDKKTTAQRLALISVLRDIGAAAEAAVPTLTRIAEDQDKRNEWASFHARGALAAIGTPSAENTVRDTAQRGLERWLAAATPVEIEKAIRENDFLIRQALRHTQPDEKTIAAALMLFRVVGRQAAAAAPTLQRLYHDDRIGAELRQSLVQTFAAVGIADFSTPTDIAQDKAQPAADPLAEILADMQSNDPLIATSAMSELARLGPSQRVIDALIGALRENHNAADAARLLGNFGPAAARALPDLLPYLKDRVAGPNTIQAVGKIGLPDPAAVGALRHITADPDSPLRGQAALALGKLRAQPAVPELTQALNATAKYDRILAAKALGMLGPAAVDAVPALTQLLRDPDTDIRLASVRSLGQIGPPAAAAVAAIARQLSSSDGRLQASAEKALATIGGAEAETLLARDATRYAKADQLAYRRLWAAGREAEIGDFLQRLPKVRGLQVARSMLTETNPALALTASAFLIQSGHGEESIPTLVDLAARGAIEGQTVTGFGWFLSHGDGKTQSQDLDKALRAYLREHKGRYSATEQSRIRRFFGFNPDGR